MHAAASAAARAARQTAAPALATKLPFLLSRTFTSTPQTNPFNVFQQMANDSLGKVRSRRARAQSGFLKSFGDFVLCDSTAVLCSSSEELFMCFL